MTDGKLTCGACGAEYGDDIRSDFECGRCGAVVSVAVGRSAKPVVKPTVKPVVPPTVKPVVPPTVKPSVPPTVKPVPAPRAAAAAAPAPASATAAAEPQVAPRRRPSADHRPTTKVVALNRPDFSGKKSLPLVPIAIGGVVVIGALLFFVMNKGDTKQNPVPADGATAGSKGAAAQTPESRKLAFDGDARVTTLKAEIPGSTPADLIRLSDRLTAEADEWKKKDAPWKESGKLTEAASDALAAALVADPDNAEIHNRRGETKYGGELAEYADAPYADEQEQQQATVAHAYLSGLAKSNNGYVPKAELAEKAKIGAALAAKKTAYAEFLESPFGQKAKAAGERLCIDMAALTTGRSNFKWFASPECKPYVVAVEENATGSGVAVAFTAKTIVCQPLNALQAIFLKEFGPSMGFQPLEDPVPVVYFGKAENYSEYAKAISGGGGAKPSAHFEPFSGRLVLNRDVDPDTIIHEGTHQLFFRYTKGITAGNYGQRSYWFQEGIAEWFGGSSRTLDPKTKQWSYEIGGLQLSRIGELRTVKEAPLDEGGLFNVPELVNTTYADKNRWSGMGGEGTRRQLLIYSQGWLFIYFLNNFAVDSEGFVQVGKPGKYAAGWQKYLRAELTGQTGRKVLMECLGLNDVGLKKLDDEYNAYRRWLRTKVNFGHVKDKRLLAWDQYVNDSGKKTGDKEDDRLVPLKKKDG